MVSALVCIIETGYPYRLLPWMLASLTAASSNKMMNLASHFNRTIEDVNRGSPQVLTSGSVLALPVDATAVSDVV